MFLLSIVNLLSNFISIIYDSLEGFIFNIRINSFFDPDLYFEELFHAVASFMILISLICKSRKLFTTSFVMIIIAETLRVANTMTLLSIANSVINNAVVCNFIAVCLLSIVAVLTIYKKVSFQRLIMLSLCSLFVFIATNLFPSISAENYNITLLIYYLSLVGLFYVFAQKGKKNQGYDFLH